MLDTFRPGGAHLPVSYLFTFSYCPWGSHGRNTGVVCYFLLQWTMICQNSLWLVCLGVALPSMAHSFMSCTNPFTRTRLLPMSMELKRLFYCLYYLLIESEMATHSVFLAGKNPMGRGASRLQSMG